MAEPIKVLVVDDDSNLLAVWKRFLSKKPEFECVGAVTTADGIAQLAIELEAHVILMDLSMEGEDPLQVISNLCETKSSARVLVYSGRSQQGFKQLLADAGAWGFADKLENPHVILEYIRQISQGKNLMV